MKENEIEKILDITMFCPNVTGYNGVALVFGRTERGRVVQICRVTLGLPLDISLAAGKWSVQFLIEQLNKDSPDDALEKIEEELGTEKFELYSLIKKYSDQGEAAPPPRRRR